MSTERIAERILGGAGRRSIPIPVPAHYALSDFIPRRTDGSYSVKGEVGAPLAKALERVMSVLESAHGPLQIIPPARFLTPRWLRVLNELAKHGLAKSIQLSLPLEDGIPLYYFDIHSPYPSHLTDGTAPGLPRYSRGFSLDYDHALAKVVGECLERGSFLYFRTADMVRGSARSLEASKMPFVPPRRFSSFDEEQTARRPDLVHGDETVFRWTWVKELRTGKRVLVPSQLIYWNYPLAYGDVPEPLLREHSTHGYGAFFTLEGALLSGLLECIQRDGFFLHWLRGIAPKRIDPSGIARKDTQRLLSLAEEVGLSATLLDVTSQLGVPTCVAVLRRKDDEVPHAVMGGSCRFDGETAIHDALLEAASVHHVKAPAKERYRLPDYQPFSDPKVHTNERLAFWCNPEHAPYLEPFLAGETTSVVRFGRGIDVPKDPRDAVERIVSIFTARGIDAWYVEAEHPALDALEYAAARVLVPDLIPLYHQERNAPLGLARLYEAEIVRGVPRDKALVPWPHPFP